MLMMVDFVLVIHIIEYKSDLKIEEARGWEQALIETKGTKTGIIGETFRGPDGTLRDVDTGNKVASFDHNRVDDRGVAFQTEYEKAMKELNNEKNIISCSQ